MKKKNMQSGIKAIFCTLLGIAVTAPVIYAFFVSFMQPAEILTTELKILPNSFRYTENYRIVFERTPVLRFMFNSFVVAFVSSVVRIVTASLAAFSFAFFEYRGKRFLFALVTLSMVIPADVLIVQNYFTVAAFGLVNTYTGMMIVFFVSSMNIFVMRQNFMAYSRSIRDASVVDGCGNFTFYSRILMPSNMPVIATVFISSFVGTWNAYLRPLQNLIEKSTAPGMTVLIYADGTEYALSLTDWVSERKRRGGDFPLWDRSDFDRQVQKVTVMAEKNRKEFSDLLPEIQALEKDFSLFIYGDAGCEIVAAHIDKAFGLRKLCARFGIGEDEVLAIGDGPNDRSMLHIRASAPQCTMPMPKRNRLPIIAARLLIRKASSKPFGHLFSRIAVHAVCKTVGEF